MSWAATGLSGVIRRRAALAPAARTALAPAAVTVAIVAVFLPLTPAYDIDVFLRAGQAIWHGRPVYPPIGTPAVYSGSAFVYPYLVAWLFAPAALVPSGFAVAAFFALSLSAVVAAGLVASNGDGLRAALILSVSFAITGLQLGALSPLLFAGAVFMWRLRERPWAFALLAAPVIVSKLFLAPLLVWPLLARRCHAFLAASGLVALLLGAGFVLGPIGAQAYLRLLSALSAHEARAGFGLIGALRSVGLTATAAGALALVVAACVVLSAFVYHRHRDDERVLFCAGLLASLILSPVLWSHYLLLIAAALLVLDLNRTWLLLFVLASWVVAPPHGVQLHTEVMGVTSVYLEWALVAGLLVWIIASVRRPRARKPLGPSAEAGL